MTLSDKIQQSIQNVSKQAKSALVALPVAAALALSPQVAQAQDSGYVCETPRGIQVQEEMNNDCLKVVSYQVEQGKTIARAPIYAIPQGGNLSDTIRVAKLGIPTNRSVIRDAGMSRQDRMSRFMIPLDQHDAQVVLGTRLQDGTPVQSYVIKTGSEHEQLWLDAPTINRGNNLYEISAQDALRLTNQSTDKINAERLGRITRTDCDPVSTLGVKFNVVEQHIEYTKPDTITITEQAPPDTVVVKKVIHRYVQPDTTEPEPDPLATIRIRSQGVYDVEIERHRPSNDPERLGTTPLELTEPSRFHAFFAPETHDGKILKRWEGCDTTEGRICELLTRPGEDYTITAIYKTPADTVRITTADPFRATLGGGVGLVRTDWTGAHPRGMQSPVPFNVEAQEKGAFVFGEVANQSVELRGGVTYSTGPRVLEGFDQPLEGSEQTVMGATGYARIALGDPNQQSRWAVQGTFAGAQAEYVTGPALVDARERTLAGSAQLGRTTTDVAGRQGHTFTLGVGPAMMQIKQEEVQNEQNMREALGPQATALFTPQVNTIGMLGGQATVNYNTPEGYFTASGALFDGGSKVFIEGRRDFIRGGPVNIGGYARIERTGFDIPFDRDGAGNPGVQENRITAGTLGVYGSIRIGGNE